MGDTDVFSDMKLIAELHGPKIAMVPIGNRFTMGVRTAAYAIKSFFNLQAVIPCHYGSFPIIASNADAFVAEMKGSATGDRAGKGNGNLLETCAGASPDGI